MNASVARALHQVLEPYHALVYFAPESRRDAYGAVGLKGYWMGYFASRAAAMGAVPPEVVMATFYNFAPRMVRRAIPDAWTLSTPALVLNARLTLADLATSRLLGDSHAALTAEAADLAEQAARAAAPEGRALFAAYASLPWPDEPRLRLWHAATLLREHRGDGHIAILIAEGIDGLESHILAAAAGQNDPVTQREHRGFTEEEWAAAEDRLRARGLIGDKPAFTDAGRELKERIEHRTDELAMAPYDVLGEMGCERLLRSMASLLGASSAIPYPNAIGLTAR